MKYLTLSEVCEALQLTRQTVVKYIESGELPAANMSVDYTKNRYRISEEELKHFMEGRKVK